MKNLEEIKKENRMYILSSINEKNVSDVSILQKFIKQQEALGASCIIQI